MWTIELPDGSLLDSLPELTLEVVSSVFTGSATDSLQGSYSYPFQIALTPNNRRYLGNPDYVNNTATTAIIEQVRILFAGTHLYTGTLQISKANGNTAQAVIIINPMANVKEKTLGDLDLGGNRTLPTDQAAHMLATAHDPLAHDYAFFPVEMYETKTLPDDTTQRLWQNQWVSGAFSLTSDVFSPFCRLDYLLSRINNIPQFAYKWVNTFQTSVELKLLYLQNNKDIRLSNGTTAPAWPGFFDLREAVPGKTLLTDVIKQVSSAFCLGLFVDHFSKTIEWIPLRDVLRSATRWDWTDYQASEQEVDQPETAPNYYNFESSGDKAPADFPPPDTLRFYETRQQAIDENTGVAGAGTYYYAGCVSGRIDLNTSSILDWQNYPAYKGVATNNLPRRAFECKLKPVDCPGEHYLNGGALCAWIADNPTTPTKYEFQQNDGEFGLMMYRGRGADSGNTPIAQATPYAHFSNPPVKKKIYSNGVDYGDAQYSMIWYGPSGLYEQWHRDWSNMLNGKKVSQRFNIPVGMLSNFRLQHKVRVANMDYLVARYRVIKSAGYGRLNIEASLISVI